MKASEIVEKIFKIEKELHLFEKQIQGVYFWKLVRFKVFMQLTQKLGVYEQAHTQQFNSLLDKIKAVFPKVKNTYLHSVFARRSKVDTLVFEHGRKVLINGEYVDIYTEYKVNQLKQNGASYEIVDRPHLGKHYHKPSKKRSYSDGITISFLIRKCFQKIKLSDSEKKTIHSIEKKITNEFDENINLELMLGKAIDTFKCQKSQYKKMLQKRAVKQVYLVVSYGYEAFIAACQELGVECIELQHGTMSRYHIGYSFPHNEKVPYFPNKIELFGQYWQDSTPLPLKTNDISIVGYPYQNKMLNKYKEITKIKNRIVFISQGTVATEMSKAALELASKNSNIEIYYKLHPGEFGRWKTDYQYLIKASKLANFHVIEREMHLYELMASSEFLVGVYSTATFEGLALQCNAILLDLPGIEYMQYLINNKVVKVAKSADDILELMKNNEFGGIDSSYFFKELKGECNHTPK